jgi:electron transport complex protein RnfE
MPAVSAFTEAAIARNPAWVQLLGLCPLLAVTTSMVSGLALAAASCGVLAGSSLSIALLRRIIPDFARLPAFVIVIATFTTCVVLLLEAFAFELYLGIALFVQIIVTNCVILARAEAFASRNPPGRALADSLGTAAGFALALLTLGAVREALGRGTLLAGMDQLLGPAAASWAIDLPVIEGGLLLVVLPPGAFIVAGLLLALGNALTARRAN